MRLFHKFQMIKKSPQSQKILQILNERRHVSLILINPPFSFLILFHHITTMEKV